MSRIPCFNLILIAKLYFSVNPLFVVHGFEFTVMLLFSVKISMTA